VNLGQNGDFGEKGKMVIRSELRENISSPIISNDPWLWFDSCDAFQLFLSFHLFPSLIIVRGILKTEGQKYL
jgi:hypothetical protein